MTLDELAAILIRELHPQQPRRLRTTNRGLSRWWLDLCWAVVVMAAVCLALVIAGVFQ